MFHKRDVLKPSSDMSSHRFAGHLLLSSSRPAGLAAGLVGARQRLHSGRERVARRWALSSASRFRAMWEGGVVSVRDTQSGQTAISTSDDDLSAFVHTAVNDIFAAEGDPIAKNLKVAFAALAAGR